MGKYNRKETIFGADNSINYKPGKEHISFPIRNAQAKKQKQHA